MKKIFDFFCDNISAVPGCKGIVLAVSGGPDSMALLDLFLKAKKNDRLDFPFACATFNHGLRKEADEEVSGVRKYCKQNGIPFYTGKKDIKDNLPKGVSLEEHARNERYAFLGEILKKTGFNYLATAHNSDDNFETLLLNIARGCGLDGLKGIQPVYERSDGIIILRPLLSFEKKELTEYCTDNGVPFFIDKSNFDDSFRRNYIRKNIVPLFKEINPSINKAALNMSQLIRADGDYLNSLALDVYEKSADISGLSLDIRQQPDPILSRAVRKFASDKLNRELTNPETASLINLIKKGHTSNRVKVGDLYFVRTYSHITVQDNNDDHIQQPVMPKKGRNLFAGHELIIEERNDYRGERNAIKIVDLNKAVLRSRSEGDYIHTVQGYGKSVRRLFIDKKIPVAVRNSIPVLAIENDVVWVAKIGVNKPYIPEIGSKYYSIKFILNKEHD